MVIGYLGGSRTDGGVVRIQAAQRALFQVAGEKGVFERIKLFRDVVLAVEVVLAEYLGKYFLGQNVLDQHLAHIGGGDTRVDRLVRMLEEAFRLLAKPAVFLESLLDHVAERCEHRRQIGLELLDRFAELGDFRPLVTKK
ncbi:hypothetical protein D3C83_23750 [compost metagenome]